LRRVESGKQISLEVVAHLTGWPTPTAQEAGVSEATIAKGMDDQRKYGGQKVQMDLSRAAHLAGWATPDANGMNMGEGLETWDARQIKNKEKHKNGNGAGMPIAVQVLTISGWPTCKAQNANNSGPSRVGNKADLQTVAGWCSPTVTDASRGVLPPRPQDTGIPLSQQVSGLSPDSSNAETKSAAAFRLNPRFSLWLMGFPTSWHDAGLQCLRSSKEQETPSFPKSRRSSSKRAATFDETEFWG
jgi:hypothetical protein